MALGQIRDRLSKDDENYWARQVEIQELAVEPGPRWRRGKKRKALRQMKVGSRTGRWDGEKRGDAWAAGAGARVAG